MEFLNYEFLGNSITDYVYFLSSFLVGLLLIIPFRLFISKLLFRLFGKDNSNNDNKKFNSLLKKPLQYFLTLLVLYFSVKFISLPDSFIHFWHFSSRSFSIQIDFGDG